MVNQHKTCSTLCKGEQQIQFKCDCNRKVKIITISDIDACHWKTVMNAPCIEIKNISLSTTDDLILITSTLSPEEIEKTLKLDYVLTDEHFARK